MGALGLGVSFWYRSHSLPSLQELEREQGPALLEISAFAVEQALPGSTALVKSKKLILSDARWPGSRQDNNVLLFCREGWIKVHAMSVLGIDQTLTSAYERGQPMMFALGEPCDATVVTLKGGQVVACERLSLSFVEFRRSVHP